MLLDRRKVLPGFRFPTARSGAVLAVGVLAAVLATAVPASAGSDPPQPSYQTNGRVWSIAFRDGVIYIGGSFTAVRPAGAAAGTETITRNHAAAIDESTGKILPWNPNVNGIVYSILAEGRRVYLGGSFSRVGGAPRHNLAAVNPSSGALRSWHPSADGYVRVIKKGPNGNLFIGGHFSHVRAKRRWRIAELTTSGKLVAWAPKVKQVSGLACPPRCPPKVWTIAFADGLVYFGGHFGLVNGVGRNSVAAVAIDDATKLTAWNPNVYAAANCPTCTTVETERVFNIIVHASKAYMCGGFWLTEGGRVRAFNLLVTNLTEGAKDPTFAAGNDGDTPACAIRRGVFYFGGHFNWVGEVCSQNPGGPSAKCTSDNATRRNHVAAVDAKTGALLPWDPGANSKTGVWALGRSRRHLGAGGDFTKIGGVSQQGFAEFPASRLP